VPSPLGQTPPSEGFGEAVPPLGGGPAVLIGHSMGGYITLAFVEKYPDAVNAFGLFHSSAFADSEEKKETRRKGVAFIEQHGAYEFLKTTTPNLFSPVTKAEKGHLIDQHLKTLRNADGAALVRYYQSMMERPDRTAVLKNAQVPVLFVLGRHDNAVPLEDGLKQCHLPQLSYIELLEQAGHMGMVEEPEKTNAILTMFTKSLERRT
jgi:pimeloyl-ACP methyl ester carboxylesterase